VGKANKNSVRLRSEEKAAQCLLDRWLAGDHSSGHGVRLNVSGDLRDHMPNMLAVAARLHPPFLRLLKPDLLAMHTLPAFNTHFPTKLPKVPPSSLI
jgi:hypothetical protein